MQIKVHIYIYVYVYIDQKIEVTDSKVGIDKITIVT